MNDLPVDRLLERALDNCRRQPPESTYRLQFHAGFTFHDAAEIAEYLFNLGITHCYASPYLKARPGSQHGYDITDHSTLNPELGTECDYREWIQALHRYGMGQILDVVPNHMAVATNDNAWWNDVLENGPASPYAAHFDIAWNASPRIELRDKVLLPFLREPYGEVVEAGDINLIFANGSFALTYSDLRFPVAPDTYDIILAHRLEELERALASDQPALLEYQSILTAIRNLPDRSQPDPAKVAERNREKEVIKRRLANLTETVPTVQQFLIQNLAEFNGCPGQPSSFDLIDRLLEKQCFRLSYWRVGTDEINYRRFFDVNDLAALSMERDDVMAATHAFVLGLIVDRNVDGLRIDHPDGLYDPARYLRRLQEDLVLASARKLIECEADFQGISWEEVEPILRARAAAIVAASEPQQWPLFIVAEKILGPDETLPVHWTIAGTTGYDFMNVVNGLFVDPSNDRRFSQLYEDILGDDTDFADIAYRKKRLILDVLLASELHMLTYQLDRLAQKSRHARDLTFNTLRQALREVITNFPVYRSYIADGSVQEEDRQHIVRAVRRAITRNPLLSPRVFRFIQNILLLEAPRVFDEQDKADQRRFIGKFQQVTAPVSAKGIEDTAFYVYNRLVSLNEVGTDPRRFGVPPDVVHAFNSDRRQKWPHSFSPLSTHDTKRSEDVRARLNILSEIPEEWKECVRRWSHMNAMHRQRIDDLIIPDANEEYLFYQSLVGTWPLEELKDQQHAGYIGRIQMYMEKALHEAKVHTSWINPNADYDNAVSLFVGRVLDCVDNHSFLEDFRGFQRRVAHLGLFNSLAQTVLRIGSPGVPDTYRGTELWDFSLVDPDNRRQVDYGLRRTMLRELQNTAKHKVGPLVRELLDSPQDGRIKMYVTFRALHCRRDNPGLFSQGTYVPLRSRGDKADHLFAFVRTWEDRYAVVAVPRFFTQLVSNGDKLTLEPSVWGTTALLLQDLPTDIRWLNVFTGADIEAEPDAVLRAAGLFADFPVALLIGSRANKYATAQRQSLWMKGRINAHSK